MKTKNKRKLISALNKVGIRVEVFEGATSVDGHIIGKSITLHYNDQDFKGAGMTIAEAIDRAHTRLLQSVKPKDRRILNVI